ncbi:LysR family transcriptional regulator [Nonomuraea roseoviolacea]|uniref:LysR family transcriptional regulator n=1 Tax=Nonomuraea roseoviolacea TaxID=103837 RepID=UPI0031DFC4D6
MSAGLEDGERVENERVDDALVGGVRVDAALTGGEFSDPAEADEGWADDALEDDAGVDAVLMDGVGVDAVLMDDVRVDAARVGGVSEGGLVDALMSRSSQPFGMPGSHRFRSGSYGECMTRRWPDLGSLELLLLIAEHGSLGKAARLHGITQASASRRLDTLERELGVPLLHRSTTGSRLTPQGEVVAGRARVALEAAGELLTGVEALRRDRDARVRVAASMTVAEYLLPGWLVALRRAAPDVEVGLRVANSGEVCRLAEEGEIDVGFIESPYVPEGLTARLMAQDRMVVVVGPRHPWARRRAPLEFAELAAAPLVMREPGSGTRHAVDRFLAGRDVAAPALELSSNAAVKVAVEAGVAPAVLSVLAVAAELREGRLVEAPVADFDGRRPLFAVWRGRTRLAGAAAELVRLAAASGHAGLVDPGRASLAGASGHARHMPEQRRTGDRRQPGKGAGG